MSDFVEAIRKERAVISGASWSFVTAIVVVAGALWIFMELIHSAEISGKDATIETQKAQIDSYKDKLSGATPDEAKAKIANLEARLAKMEPRRLSSEQRNSILSSLTESGGVTAGSGILSHDMTRADCAQYAADFEEVLLKAHWQSMPSGVVGAAMASPKGIAILTPDPSNPLPEAKALAEALVAANIPFDMGKSVKGPPGLPAVEILITPRSTLPN